MRTINLNKSPDLLGKKLMRGCQISRPFYSQVIGGKVGNIRTALTYLAREGVDKEIVGKSKLTKSELDKLVSLPKRKIANYDNVVKILLSERIRNDGEIAVELCKFFIEDKKYFAVEFISEDEHGRRFEDMNRYCKILNRLMSDPVLVSIVLENSKLEKSKERSRFTKPIGLKDVKSRVNKSFDKSRPFVKKDKEFIKTPRENKVVEKTKVVKNFKKQLPYTKKI